MPTEELLTQFSQLFIHYYSHKSRSTCKLFVSNPSKAQEAVLGRLFGIIEFHTPSRENTSIISQLIAVLEEAYYSQAETATGPVEHLFESALQIANAEFIKILQQSPSYLIGTLNETNISEKIHLCIGVICGDELYLTYLNQMGVFLVHRGKQDYSIINIVSTAKDQHGSASAKSNLFSQIISGKLLPDDYLFVANKDVLEFISLERIRKIVSSLPPHKATEYFKNALLQYEGYNFGAIVVQQRRASEAAMESPSSLRSIGVLNKTESATERLLSPAFMPSMGDIANSVKKAFSRKSGTQQSIPAVTETERQRPSGQTVLRTGIQRSGSAVLSGLSMLMGKLFPPERFSAIYRFFQLKFTEAKHRAQRIPNISKLLLILALISGGILTYSIVFMTHSQEQQQLSGKFAEQVTAIENTLAQAQAKLIIGDELGARPLLAQAQTESTLLTVESSRQKEAYQALQASLQGLIAKIRRITTVEPSFIAVLAQNAAASKVSSIVQQGDTLYSFDTLTNSILEVQLGSHETTPLVSAATELAGLTKARNFDDAILLYTTKGFFILNPRARTLTAVTSAYTSADHVTDFIASENRLYTLDAAANKITRTSIDSTTIAPGVSWLSAPVNLSDAVGMGIDSNIWVGRTNGTVLKLRKGSPTAFQVVAPEPVIEQATEFYTDDSSNFLYVLEPRNRRIVVFDKSGAFITQYYSETFSDLRTFAVNEKEKRIYVVNGGSLYAFPLSHVK